MCAHGSAERSAKIVLHQVVVAHGIERGGVEGAIAQKFIGGAMKLVRAGARHNVDLTASGAAHLGGVASGLHLEFLHCIGRRTEIESVECRVGIGGAVEQEVVRVGPISSYAHSGALPGPPVQGVHVAGLRAVTFVRAWNSEHQVDQHPSVERKFLNGNRLDHFAHGGVGGMQRGGDGRRLPPRPWLLPH